MLFSSRSLQFLPIFVFYLVGSAVKGGQSKAKLEADSKYVVFGFCVLRMCWVRLIGYWTLLIGCLQGRGEPKLREPAKCRQLRCVRRRTLTSLRGLPPPFSVSCIISVSVSRQNYCGWLILFRPCLNGTNVYFICIREKAEKLYKEKYPDASSDDVSAS